MNIVAAVTTAPRRVSYLIKTLESLKSGGFARPLVAADAPDPSIEPAYLAPVDAFSNVRVRPARRRLGAFRNWRRALRLLSATAPEADAYALFQDDVRVARSLSGWLHDRLWPDNLARVGVVSLYTPGPHIRSDGWHRLDVSESDPRGWGAVAYVFPSRSARRILGEDHLRRGSRRIDTAVAQFCARQRLGYWLHSPSLVQHVGEVSTLSDFGLTSSRRAGRFLADASPHVSVTAVLLNWKRPYHLKRIVDELRQHPFVDEIIIWNNASEPVAVEALGPSGGTADVRVVNSKTNVGTYGRFLGARLARNQTIYTQDDDCLVTEIGRLYRAFVRRFDAITAGLVRGHFDAEAHREPWLQLGWGSFFQRDWSAVLDAWIARYGKDPLLYRKADRIFTALFGRHDPHCTEIVRLVGPEGEPSDSDKNALWLQPDHRRLTQEAVAKALALRDAATIGVAANDHE